MAWRRVERKAARSRTIGDEVEAFLCGHTADLYEAADQPAPCWAQLNRLARGDLDDLRLLTHMAVEKDRTTDSWCYVLHRLARQVLEVSAGTEDGLLEVQHEVLQPLEELLLQSPNGPVTTPGTVFHLSVGALGDFCSRQVR